MKLRLITIFALFISVSGCSTQFYYRNIDWILPWYLDDYVEFTEQQEQWFDVEIDTVKQWHQREQLPLYLGTLRRMQSTVLTNVSRDDLVHFYTDIYSFWDEFISGITPHLFALVKTANAEQVTYLFDALARDNDRFSENAVEQSKRSLGEQRAERIKNITDGFEDWFGELSTEQVTLITLYAKKFKANGDAVLRFRTDWQHRMHTLITQYHDGRLAESSFKRQFEQLLQQYQSIDSYQPLDHIRKHNLATLIELELDVIALASTQQKQHVYDKLQGMIEDVTELANDA